MNLIKGEYLLIIQILQKLPKRNCRTQINTCRTQLHPVFYLNTFTPTCMTYKSMTYTFYMQNMHCYNNRFSSVSDLFGSIELTVISGIEINHTYSELSKKKKYT